MAKKDFTTPLTLNGDYPNLDDRYTNNGDPYTSVSAAQTALASKLNAYNIGLTVLVKESGWTEAKEYWVQPKGTTPETYGLVEKGAGTTDYNDLDNKPTIGDWTNTVLPIVGNIKVSASTASGSTAGVTVTPGQNTGEIEMQFTLPKGDKGADGQDGQDGAPGADAVNPFKGYYPSGVSKPDTGAVGDYLYAPPSDSQSTATATIWHYDSTQTPPWTDTGIDVSAVVGVEFGSGQSVSATKIKGINGEEVQGPADVLSAEAGKALDEEINGAMEWVDITSEIGVIDGAYYNCHSDPMPSSKTQNEHTTSDSCAKIRCTAGQKFKLTTKGNNDYVQAYVFADESRNKLLEAKTSMTTSNKTYTDEEITAPADSYWLYLNTTDNNNNPITLKKYQNDGTGIKHDIEVLDERVEALEGQSVIDNLTSTSTDTALSANQGRVLNEKFIGSNAWGSSGIVLYGDHKCYYTYYGVGNSISGPQSSGNTLCSCGMVTCKVGDKFKIYGKGGGQYTLLYAFTGDDNKITRLATNHKNTRTNGLELTAEEGETRLYVNFIDYSSETDKLDKYIHTDGVDDKIEQLEDAIPDTSIFEQKPWKGKTIVLFGDSLSEYKGTGNKRWSDFAEEALGATIINCAIGGSQIHRRGAIVPLRGAIVPLFSTSENYVVGDKLFNNPNGVMCYYTCIEAHTAGSWDSSHFACAFDKYTPLSVGDMVIYQPSGGSYGLYECIAAHSAGNWDDSHFTYVRAASGLSSFYTYANLDMISMIEAVCSDGEDKYDTVIAANAFMTAHHIDDNDAIISAYTAIDWTKVDAVVVMGGANDFSATNMASLLNEQDAYDASKVLGAINSIVRTFCGKYKSIPLYFSTDTVRWFKYGASAEEINFCDTWYGYKRFDPTESVAHQEYVVYNPNGDDVFNAYYCKNQNGHQGEWDAADFNLSKSNVITYTEFFDAIKAEWKKLHIPVIDLYNMLGWTMWNFSQYFPTNNQTWGYDGTHPRLGFKNIGEYIARWLIAHKNA